MAISKIKRTIWALNEFVNAYPGGITIKELGAKWANSSMNDEKEPDIPVRTFHRVRREVESVFGVTIECVKGSEPRYRISLDDLEAGTVSFLSQGYNHRK